jgi:hypothetical protein
LIDFRTERRIIMNRIVWRKQLTYLLGALALLGFVGFVAAAELHVTAKVTTSGGEKGTFHLRGYASYIGQVKGVAKLTFTSPTAYEGEYVLMTDDGSTVSGPVNGTISGTGVNRGFFSLKDATGSLAGITGDSITDLPVLSATTAGLLASPSGQGPFLMASALFFGRSGGITWGHINTDSGEGEITFDAIINLP